MCSILMARSGAARVGYKCVSNVFQIQEDSQSKTREWICVCERTRERGSYRLSYKAKTRSSCEERGYGPC